MVTKAILDTNAYIHFLQGKTRELNLMRQIQLIYMPAVVYGELYYGFLKSQRFEQNLNQLHAFLDEPQLELVSITKTTAIFFGRIKDQLSKIGRSIPINDVWIAACGRELSVPIITRDQHFKLVDGLAVI